MPSIVNHTIILYTTEKETGCQLNYDKGISFKMHLNFRDNKK